MIKPVFRSLSYCLLMVGFVGCVEQDSELTLSASGRSEVRDSDERAEKWTDIDGNAHQLFASGADRLCVLVFVTTDCPVANAYQPTLREIAKEFAEADVDFYQINPTKSATIEKAKQHVADFDIASPMILDPDQTIARRVGAEVTPESFLISPQQEILYRGRIDDLYVGFGNRRQSPTSHDLRDAITAALAAKPISTSVTKAIGCLIQYGEKGSL